MKLAAPSRSSCVTPPSPRTKGRGGSLDAVDWILGAVIVVVGLLFVLSVVFWIVKG